MLCFFHNFLTRGKKGEGKREKTKKVPPVETKSIEHFLKEMTETRPPLNVSSVSGSMYSIPRLKMSILIS